MTHSEMHLLSTIGRITNETGAGPKVSDISHLLNVAPPTITQQLNALESRGLVERQMDTGDRRVIRVTLTPSGHAIILKAREAFIAALTGLVEYLGEEDSNRLADLLQKAYTYFHESKI
jgi:DNA-binding MarR family transcriptional regulator